MAQVTVTVHGRRYAIGCQDGQEEHLQKLAAYIDQRAAQLGDVAKSLSEPQLLLMSSLMIADELHESLLKLEKLQEGSDTGEIPESDSLSRNQPEQEQKEPSDVADALVACADRLEKIATRLEKD
ncbi:cell division protein ZapA [Kiloniella sp. b19]|uniref:cell division protein ZapA n=1 Tax=Kiloniella sp. GXU_MW_B19 TaxID=3141326 RepID=UPI0031D35C50